MDYRNIHLGNEYSKREYYDTKTETIVKECYYICGNFHRDDDTPAIIEYYEDGKTIKSEHYYKYGHRYRDNDRPTVLNYYKSGKIMQIKYYDSHRIHRINGPARITYDTKGDIIKQNYFLNGKECNEIEYFIRLGKLK